MIAQRIAAELPYLSRIARRWPQQDWGDLVQATACKALGAQHQFSGDGNDLRAWLSKILYHEAVSGFRRAGWFVEGPAPDVADHRGWTAIFRLELAEVERAIKKLPAKQQIAINLVCVRGLSYAEAGRVMRLSENAVRGHLHRARQALRREGGQ
jgi:RNA polymerase sigma-70 factor (ECF subfamily)